MRNPVLALLAAAVLVASWSFVTRAQVVDSTPCEKSCYEQESVCVSACGEHDDPVECEGQCEDQLDDCLEQCR